MSSARRQTTQQERRTQPREADIVAIPVQTQPVYEREPQMPLERIGDILRQTRQRRGDDLGAIADYLCIRRGFLEALENSRYDEFPADAYVIGFLRSYAELLGLDGKEAIDRYRAEMSGRRKKPSLVLPTPITEGRAPSVFVLIGAVIAALLVYALWYGLSTSDRASVSVAPPLPSAPTMADATPAPPAAAATPIVQAATTPTTPGSITINAVAPPESIVPSAPVPATENPATPAAQAPAKPTTEEASQTAAQEKPLIAIKPTHVVIKAQQSSWVMIYDNRGNTIFDHVLKPGETYNVPDKPDLLLTTGNPAGIVLTLDGTDLPKLSPRTSGIMRDIPIDTAHLKNLQPRD